MLNFSGSKFFLLNHYLINNQVQRDVLLLYLIFLCYLCQKKRCMHEVCNLAKSNHAENKCKQSNSFAKTDNGDVL